MADGLGVPVSAALPFKPASSVFAARLASQHGAPFTKSFFQKPGVNPQQIANADHADFIQAGLGHLAYAGNLFNRERGEKALFLSRYNIKHAVGLGLVRTYFGHQARTANADG